MSSAVRLPYVRWPLLLYAAKWTVLLVAVVTVASFSAQIAFLWAMFPDSPFSRSCHSEAFSRFPLDIPSEMVCLPQHMVRESLLDYFVPVVFAGILVGVSACLIRSVWEH